MEAFSVHCTPALYLHMARAVPRIYRLERFRDDVHIEHMAFKGAASPKLAAIPPDLSRPGRGLVAKRRDAELHLAA